MAKFSIRDLLSLTVVVALAVGWWADRQRWQVLRQEYERAGDRLLQRGTNYRGMVQQYEDALIDVRSQLPASVRNELPGFLDRNERDPPRDRWPDSPAELVNP